MKSTPVRLPTAKQNPGVSVDKSQNEKPKKTGYIVISFTDTTLSVAIGRHVWHIGSDGVLVDVYLKHNFKCSWSLNGDINAILYGRIDDMSKTMRTVLMDKAIRDWLVKNSKRPLPSDFAVVG